MVRPQATKLAKQAPINCEEAHALMAKPACRTCALQPTPPCSRSSDMKRDMQTHGDSPIGDIKKIIIVLNRCIVAGSTHTHVCVCVCNFTPGNICLPSARTAMLRFVGHAN